MTNEGIIENSFAFFPFIGFPPGGKYWKKMYVYNVIF